MYQSHHPVPAIVIATLLPVLECVPYKTAFNKLPEDSWLFRTFAPEDSKNAIFCLQFDDEIQMLQQGATGLVYTGTNQKFRDLMEIKDEKGLVTLGSLQLILSYSGPERAAEYVQRLLELTTEEAQLEYQTHCWQAMQNFGSASSAVESDQQPNASAAANEEQPNSPASESKSEQPHSDKPTKSQLLDRYSRTTAIACVAVAGFVLGFWAGRQTT